MRRLPPLTPALLTVGVLALIVPAMATGSGSGDRMEHRGASGGMEMGHDHEAMKRPNVAEASRAQRRQADALRRRVHRVAARRFPTYRHARRLGYERLARHWKRPLVFHVRRASYDHDGRIFDAFRPEALVYWWPRRGAPVLIGFMFRAPAGKRPRFAGPIPIYHRHTGHGGQGPSQMTHVWLTHDLVSAWSNCLPVEPLEHANHAFRYARPASPGSGPEARPC